MLLNLPIEGLGGTAIRFCHLLWALFFESYYLGFLCCTLLPSSPPDLFATPLNFHGLTSSCVSPAIFNNDLHRDQYTHNTPSRYRPLQFSYSTLLHIRYPSSSLKNHKPFQAISKSHPSTPIRTTLVQQYHFQMRNLNINVPKFQQSPIIYISSKKFA